MLPADTEWCVSTGRLVVLSIAGELIHAKQVDRALVRDLFAEPTIWAAGVTDFIKIGEHVGSFDEIFDALEHDRVYDVLTRQRLLDIAAGIFRKVHPPKPKKGKRPGPYSVAAVAWRHGFHKDHTDEWRMRYGELIGLPLELWPAAAREYAASDSVVNGWIYDAQEAKEHDGVFGDQHRQTRKAWALQLAANTGILVDQAEVERFAARVTAELNKHREILRKAGIVRPDGTRSQAAAQERAGLAGVRQRTKTGYSLTREACEDTRDPVLQSYAIFTSEQKNLTTYVDMLRSASPRLHGSYEELVDTGRTSMRRPSLQVLPRVAGVRECLVADPGRCLISVDVDKAELVSLAQIILELFGKSQLADALRAGIDPHCMIGAQIKHLSLDDFMARYLAGDNSCADARQDGKPGNFGFSGGMGESRYVSYSKAQGRPITIERAFEIKAAWRRAWPDIVAYLRWIGRLAERSTSVQQFKSGRLRGGLSYCDMANGFFQGLTADAMGEVLWELAKLQRTIDSRTLVFIHDEVIVDATIKDCHDIAMATRDLVQNVYSRWTPDIPVTAEPRAMFRWSKSAKPVYENGKLTPWTSPKS